MEPLIAVVGATGTGKSQLAVDLAKRFNGEVVNGDAMQMYRGLPIITNKISEEEKEGIPHHLINTIGLEDETWRISTFRKETLKIIKEIRSRGRLPILVGGTHYYTQAVLFKENLVDGEEAEEDHEEQAEIPGDERAALKRKDPEKWAILDAPAEEMLAKLWEVDPKIANRWHPADARKIRRSLEIYLHTGRRPSEIYEEQRRQKQESTVEKAEKAVQHDGFGTDGQGHLRFQTLIFWPYSEREALKERLDTRVDQMIDNGLIAEANELYEYLMDKESQGTRVDLTKGIWVSIGFKELEPYLSAVRTQSQSATELEQTRALCIEQVKASTRQYARRQIQWIKHKLWVSLADAGSTNRLYLLDTTDVPAWTSNVREPAEAIVHAFLSNEPRQNPLDVSGLARRVLGEAENADAERLSPDERFQLRKCDLCDRIFPTLEQYQSHMKGRGHKSALKAREKRAQRDAYFVKRGIIKPEEPEKATQ